MNNAEQNTAEEMQRDLDLVIIRAQAALKGIIPADCACILILHRQKRITDKDALQITRVSKNLGNGERYQFMLTEAATVGADNEIKKQ